MHICFDAWKHCHMQACNQLRLNMCISKSNVQICLFSFLCSSSSSQESPEKKSKASNELEKSKNFAKLRRFDLLCYEKVSYFKTFRVSDTLRSPSRLSRVHFASRSRSPLLLSGKYRKLTPVLKA